MIELPPRAMERKILKSIFESCFQLILQVAVIMRSNKIDSANLSSCLLDLGRYSINKIKNIMKNIHKIFLKSQFESMICTNINYWLM